MPLGSAILRPQALAQAPADGDMRAFDLVVELIESLIKKPEVTQALGSALAEVLIPKLQSFLLGRQEKLRFAEGRLRKIFRPFVDLVMEFVDSMDEGVANSLPGALDMLRGLTGLLGSENVSHLLRELLDTVESDLDVNGEAIEDLFREVMQAAIEKLQDPANQGDLSEDSLSRFEMGTHLRSLEHLILEELDWPDLDKEVLVEALVDLWQRNGFDRLLGDLNRLLENLGDLIEPLAQLLETMLSLRFEVELSVGAKATPEIRRRYARQARGFSRERAARAQFAGRRATGKNRNPHNADETDDTGDTGVAGGAPGESYAEWDPYNGPSASGARAGGPFRSVGAAAPPGDEETTVTDASPISFYASWVLRHEARFTIDDGTERIGPIPAITYKGLTPKQMEQVAFHTLWIVDLTETLLHIISAEQGDIAVNTLNAFWDFFNTLNTPINKLYLPSWTHWAVIPHLVLLGGLEGGRFDDAFGDDPYLWTIMLGDMGETVLYRRWTWLARELFLSVFTMANHDPADYEAWVTARKAQPDYADLVFRIGAIEERLESPPVLTVAQKHDLENELNDKRDQLEVFEFEIRQGNHNQFHGMCYASAEIFGLLLPLILAHTDRMNYGFIGGGPTGPMVGKAFGGWAISMSAGYLSLLLVPAISGQWPDDGTNMAMLPFKERFVWNPKKRTGGEIAGRVFWAIGSALIEWVMQTMYLYLFTNGNTSGGTFAPLAGFDVRFLGFPENPEGSPYRLPWNSGETKECVQNPLGIWSHFPASGQTYAIDYNHDAGDDVANSRTGVVTALTVNNANNNTQNWNSIEITHLQVLPAGSTGPNIFPAVPGPGTPAAPGPTAVTYTDNVTPLPAIETGTLFPPYWDVNGNPWPLLPNPMFLHPSQAILPGGTAVPGGQAAGVAGNSMFSFIDANYDRGLAGRTYPAGATFSDGTTAIPLGVVFTPDAPNPPNLSTPFYRAGTTFAVRQAGFNATPYPTGAGVVGVPGFTPAPGALFLDGVPIPAGVELPPDCGATPLWLPAPHPATPMYMPGNQYAIITNNTYFNAGTQFISVGTTFPAIPPAPPGGGVPNVNFTWFTPLVFTFCEYGHAIAGFTSIPNFTNSPLPAGATAPAVVPLPAGGTRVAPPGEPAGPLTDAFGTPNNNQILGQLVPQGQVIMLAGDTGNSAYDHLHTHVNMISTAVAGNFTIPFVYADAVHNMQHGFREAPQSNGEVRAMTWYTSRNPS